MNQTHFKLRVRDLRSYLDRNHLSPEKLAEQTQLSHMTIRRWLKCDEKELLPEKYYPILAPIFAQQSLGYGNLFPTSLTVEDLMSEVEKSGLDLKLDSNGEKKLGKDVTEKLKSARVDRLFFDYCKQLMQAVRSPKISVKSKALAAGALIYFISPIDMIPDHIPVIGYLDDLAVLSLAVNTIKSNSKKQN